MAPSLQPFRVGGDLRPIGGCALEAGCVDPRRPRHLLARAVKLRAAARTKISGRYLSAVCLVLELRNPAFDLDISVLRKRARTCGLNRSRIACQGKWAQ